MDVIKDDIRHLYADWFGTTNCITSIPEDIARFLQSRPWDEIFSIDNHLCDCRADLVDATGMLLLTSFHDDVMRWYNTAAISHMVSTDMFIPLLKKALLKTRVFNNKSDAERHLNSGGVLHRPMPSAFQDLIPEYLGAILPSNNEFLGVIIPTSAGVGFAINEDCIAIYERDF